MKNGFSLVELSIVLVILGLLVGGILAGKSLIRAAELRSAVAEYGRYYTAAKTFRDKYFAVPGDFSDASRFWGRMNSNADCATNSSASVASTGACDGDGGGTLPWTNSGAVSTAQEMHQFWRHLNLAGLIEGNYSGLAGPTLNSADVVPGTNSPISKLGNAGWGAGQLVCGSGAACYATLTSVSAYPPYLMLGARVTTGGNVPKNPAMKPEESWNIDTKLDDGLPASGRVIAYWGWVNGCTTSATNTDATGTYNLASSTISCSLFFLNAF